MTLNKFSYSLLLAALFTVVAIGCKKKENVIPDTNTPVLPVSPTDDYTKLGNAYATGAGVMVEVYGKEAAFTGYNKIYIALRDSVTNDFIESAEVKLAPKMQMATMSHAAPFENPASTAAVNKLFPATVSFIMSSSTGTWTLGVQVQHFAGNKTGTANVVIDVKDPTPMKMFSFESPVDSGKYFIGFIPPANPTTGLNDFGIVVYKKASMIMFPPDSSMTVTFEPEMPTMNHGSPDNVQPVHVGNGHYKGKVNFTMPGLWRMHMEFKSGTTVVDATHYFDFTL